MGKRNLKPKGFTPPKITRQDGNIHVVEWDITGEETGWSRRILLRGDAHHDNVNCDQAMERRHLQEVVDCGGMWVDCGDLFCAMGGKYDRRSKMNHIRPEYIHPRREYLDLLVEKAVDFYGPFARYCITIARGNHELAVNERHDTDLTERLCEGMATKFGHRVHPTGYGGWVVFLVRRGKAVHSKRMAIFHGAGGGGMMTMGTLSIRREASFLDADIYVSGHIHERWSNCQMRHVLTQHPNYGWKNKLLPIKHVRVGTYKEEYGTREGMGASAYHVGKGRPPKPIGAMWLELAYVRRLVKHVDDAELTIRITEAI